MEDKAFLPEMQHGSRDGKQCISAVLNKQLSHDIVCHQKITAAFIENDAIGCYDRMVNNLLLLELRRLGVPLPTILALALTWDNAAHHIKTQYGVSSQTYQNTSTTPLFSPGQGSTLGPFLWLLLFTLIVDSLCPSSPQATFISVDRSLIVHDTGEAFVDDSFLCVTSNHSYDTTKSVELNYCQAELSAVQRLQELAQQWEKTSIFYRWHYLS
jgi:hypothetical protein